LVLNFKINYFKKAHKNTIKMNTFFPIQNEEKENNFSNLDMATSRNNNNKRKFRYRDFNAQEKLLNH